MLAGVLRGYELELVIHLEAQSNGVFLGLSLEQGYFSRGEVPLEGTSHPLRLPQLPKFYPALFPQMLGAVQDPYARLRVVLANASQCGLLLQCLSTQSKAPCVHIRLYTCA